MQGRVAGTLNSTITISWPAAAEFETSPLIGQISASQASSPPRFAADVGQRRAAGGACRATICDDGSHHLSVRSQDVEAAKGE